MMILIICTSITSLFLPVEAFVCPSKTFHIIASSTCSGKSAKRHHVLPFRNLNVAQSFDFDSRNQSMSQHSYKSPLFIPPKERSTDQSRIWVTKRFRRKMRDLLQKKGMINLPKRRPLGRFITSFFKIGIVFITWFIMKVLNRTHVHDPNDNLQRYAFHRDINTGLLTISNHCSIMDDPGLWIASLPIRKLTLDNVRNIIMVEESYNFLGKISANILHGLNCLPIKRGDIRGLESPQLFELYKRLNGAADYIDDEEKKKEWCHIMIEGRILQPWRYELPHGNSLPQLGKFRLGAAKLIATSPPTNLVVLPIYHYGMHNIFPETPPKHRYKVDASGDISTTRISGKTKFQFPRWGNRIDIYVGEPIDFNDLVPKYGFLFRIPTDRNLLNEINSRLREAMLDLEAKASQDRLPTRIRKGKRASTHFVTL